MKTWIVAGAAVSVLVVGLGAMGWWRTHLARVFSRPHHVQTAGGTNYVLSVTAVTLGKTEGNYLVILTARVENPNAFELLLHRARFVLTDSFGMSHLPLTNGIQTAQIRIPPNSASEAERFSYVVPPRALDGSLMWCAGHQYKVSVKNARPYRRQLRDGEFATFRRQNW
ncbi:MAG: hypothetical protein N3B01_01395 [Verrucomicrobiae bacterium]|nr:hypothetical protein [Verrucomicrobiae bacterium]